MLNLKVKRFFKEMNLCLQLSFVVAVLFTCLVTDKDFMLNLNEYCRLLFKVLFLSLIPFICSTWIGLKSLTKKMFAISFEFLARVFFIFGLGGSFFVILVAFLKKLDYSKMFDSYLFVVLFLFISFFIVSVVLLFKPIKEYKHIFLQWRKKTIFYSLYKKK